MKLRFRGRSSSWTCPQDPVSRHLSLLASHHLHPFTLTIIAGLLAGYGLGSKVLVALLGKGM